MPSLPGEFFSLLETAVVAARTTAEMAAQAALNALAVNRPEPFGTLSPEKRRLRNALRARARQLGDGSQTRGLQPLVEEIAYQQWHRMLFARFLAENRLLMHPSGVPVALRDCAELASEEGEVDAWSLAARYASAALPGIFRDDDPALQIRFAPEGRLELEAILNQLPSQVFTADDSLGWMYQFWQARKKEEVNASGRKIGGADIAPVTQLFTEDYMVRFLLENSLGAWWAARHPDSPLLNDWIYLRFCDDGTPAAGTFPGWPARAAEVTVMDPCCGSGHFLVAAFEMLRRMRTEEEGLEGVQAADAVLRDNLFGLEIDPRCTQIAAFALALAAWKVGGYRPLPAPNVACSGLPVRGQLAEWTNLAGKDGNLRKALEQLHQLFQDAPDLGSLIDSTLAAAAGGPLFAPGYSRMEPLLERALTQERVKGDPTATLFGTATVGTARAAVLLGGRYTLVATNVPYLTRSKHSQILMGFCERQYPDSKADLATAFLERCRAFVRNAGSYATVTPHNWLFLTRYSKLRHRFLKEQSWNCISPLGAGAFGTISGEVVKVVLSVLTNRPPDSEQTVTGIDAAEAILPRDKAELLRKGPLSIVAQTNLLLNPDARVSLQPPKAGPLLAEYAYTAGGLCTFDSRRFLFKFWELPEIGSGWLLSQTTVRSTKLYGGRSQIVRWEDGKGQLYDLVLAMKAKGYTSGIWQAGRQIWGTQGVLVSLMGSLPCTLYTGQPFDNNTGVLVPRDPALLPVVWAFCSSPEFNEAVRRIDKKMNVTNATLAKVPFDLARWKAVAGSVGPLPEPHSDEPTQWLFMGHPAGSTVPLQVAVARVLGYSWPQQKEDGLDTLADPHGIVCLPAVAGGLPAAERLRAMLAATYGEDWSPARQEELLAAAGFGGKELADWLRDGFFAQHCKLFHNRPFIWHIWDGRRDGFSALVNYHKLNTALLDKLIYTYLGDWVKVQRGKRDAGEAGAEGRLVAALELQEKLEAIRDGEPPYDIYVRWKPLHEQPIGWDPDLNDGVRLNIRPFVTAGVLRRKFTVHWRKDRGKDPGGSERHNDLHFSVSEKLEARKQWEATETQEVEDQDPKQRLL